MSSPKMTAWLVLVVLMIISMVFINLRYEFIKQRHELEMSSLLNSAHKNLEQTLKASYNSNLAVAMTINDKGVPEDFNKVASDIIKLNPIIDIIELVPNGVIKYVYPLKTNESVLDYNILRNPLVADEANRAIERKSMYFAGPFELKQGGLAIAGRYPIYNKNKFWGFSAIIIRFDNLIEATGIYNFQNPKYYFQFSKINLKTGKEEFFLSQSTDLKDKIYNKIFIPDGDWNLYIIDNQSNTYFIAELLPYLIICVLLWFIVPYLIFIILKKPLELEQVNVLQAKRLQHSDAKFQMIFNKTSIAIAQLNQENQAFIEVNQEFCKLISVDANLLVGKSFADFVHPEDLTTFTEFIQKNIRIITNNKSIVIRLQDGVTNYIWTRIVPSPLFNEAQNIKTIILAIENISERKIAEERLIQSEVQYRSLFQESPIPLWEEDGSEVKKRLVELNLMNSDRDFVKDFFKNNPAIVYEIISKIKVLSVNQECLNLYRASDKYELIQIFGKSMSLSPTDTIIEMLVDISQGLKKGRTEGNVIFPDGREAIFAMRWNIVAGYEENFGRFIISTEDISAQVLAQKLIMSSEQKLQSIINSIDGIVWEYDVQEQRFLFVSKKVQTFLGYTSEQWLNDETFWEKNLHPDDYSWAKNHYEERLHSQSYFNYEYRMIAENGTIVWFRDIVNVHRLDDGRIILRGIMIDITMIKQNENDLNKSLEMVTEQNKRLLNFSYIVSHNLRSHTSNIQSLAVLTKESTDEEEKLKLINLIETVSNDLNDTITNLNEVINIRQNITLHVQSLVLVNFILKTLDALSEEIRTKHIEIIGKIPPNVVVNYNKAYLQSILVNIISNAVRYCKKNDDNRFIKFSCFETNNFLVLEIEDNGVGINMNRNKDKIFGLYKTFNNNKDAKGIGLFLTKNQIEAMGGKIVIQSELHVGTKVQIFFQK